MHHRELTLLILAILSLTGCSRSLEHYEEFNGTVTWHTTSRSDQGGYICDLNWKFRSKQQENLLLYEVTFNLVPPEPVHPDNFKTALFGLLKYYSLSVALYDKDGFELFQTNIDLSSSRHLIHQSDVKTEQIVVGQIEVGTHLAQKTSQVKLELVRNSAQRSTFSYFRDLKIIEK